MIKSQFVGISFFLVFQSTTKNVIFLQAKKQLKTIDFVIKTFFYEIDVVVLAHS